MSKSNQHDNPVDDSGNVPVKRSRSRKYPRPGEEGSKYIELNPRIIHNIEGDDNALVPPGFEAAVQQPQRGTLKFELKNVEEGQEILVVVDRIYSDGYWVSFKDVDSGRTSRGLICDNGHYFPVVDENKVTLGVPMLPRHIVPFLPECLTQVPKSEVMTQASQGREKSVLNDIPIVKNSSKRKKIEIIDLEEEELDQPMPMQGLQSLEHSASASTSSKMTKLVQDEQSGEPKAEELGTDELDDGGSTG